MMFDGGRRRNGCLAPVTHPPFLEGPGCAFFVASSLWGGSATAAPSAWASGGRLSGHIASRLQPIWLPLAAGARAQALQASGMGLPATLAGTCKTPSAPACQVTEQVQML